MTTFRLSSDVETPWVKYTPDQFSNLYGYRRHPPCRNFIDHPDVRNMLARNNKGMPKRGRIVGKEGHDVVIAIDYASIEVFPFRDHAKWTFRIVCKHLLPKSLGSS